MDNVQKHNNCTSLLADALLQFHKTDKYFSEEFIEHWKINTAISDFTA
jgi:hypothetical protein